MRIHWKKHLAIPVLALAVGLFAAVAASTFAAKDNGTFRLADLAGSREAIADIAIGGELRDGYMRTAFRLERGRLTASTETFEQPRYMDLYSYNPGSDLRIGDKQYSVQGSGPFEIPAFKRQKYNLYGFDSVAQASPPIVYGRLDANSINLANPLEYGLASAGGNVFFAVPTAADATGTNGIYELHFVDFYYKFSGHLNEHPSKRIAEIDLSANKSPEEPNLEILGLEGVGDKLALLTVEGGQLIVRGYDGASGAALGEAAVPDFRPGISNVSYEAFADPERSALTVGFFRGVSQELLLSFDLSDGVRLANQVLADFGDDGRLSYGTSAMRWKNGKLYVLKALREPRPEGADPARDNLLPQHFNLYVYEQSKLVYKGELVTDWNDDNASNDYESKRAWTNLSIE